MAEGGPVDHFCTLENAHKPSCDYFADGGRVGAPQPSLIDLKASSAAALAHGGASMLFGRPNQPYFSAFGRMPTSSKLGGDETTSRMMGFMSKVDRGHKAIEKGVSSLFGDGSHDIEDPQGKETDSIKEYIDKGGSEQELQDFHNQPAAMFASGGQVAVKQEDPLSSALPDHNLALNTAKSRLSGYLSGMKPQDHLQVLPFDKQPPEKVINKKYDRAVHMAARPLSILKQIKDGSITPSSLKDFGSMYPELHEHLSRKMEEKIVEAKQSGKKPSYRVRQGMSLFLGTPLDSTMTPSNIMAAQNTFLQKKSQQQQQAPTTNKRGTSTLTKVSKQYETESQASEARQKE